MRALGRMRHGARAGRLQGCGLQQRRLVLLGEAVAEGLARAVLSVARRLRGTVPLTGLALQSLQATR